MPYSHFDNKKQQIMISPAVKCLIGAIMVKFGQALLFTWGKCNIYYYSYYKESDPDLSIQYNTLPIAICAFPLAIFSLVSMQIAKKIGHRQLICIVSVIQGFCLILSFVMPTYLSFIIFYLVINATGFALVVYPLLNCIWSHYPKQEGKISGLLMGVFSFGIILNILMITGISNPDNDEAQLEGTAGKTTFHYFDHKVAKNVPGAVLVASIVTAASMIIGSVLVTHNSGPVRKNLDIELPKAPQIVDQPVETEKQIDAEIEAPVEPPNKLNEDISSANSAFSAPLSFHQDNQPLEPQTMPSMKGAVKKAMLSSQFLIFFMSQFALYQFLVSLSTNYKTYALSKYNNDYYVTFVDLLGQLIGGGLSFVWGYLLDRVSFVLLYSLLIGLAGANAILVSLTTGQISFTIFYIGWTIFCKGAILVVNPGLVKVYSNDLGTKLLSVLNISTVLAFLLAPLGQLVFQSVLNFDYLLVMYAVNIVLSAILITRLHMTYVSK